RAPPQHICAPLRRAAIDAGFDPGELRGAHAWHAAIRRQIKSCALFVPITSANTHTRAEGYFRLEWKLAVDRSHLIAPDKAYLVPVAIDNTPESDERIPDRFRELQWTRLPGGETPPTFVERVQRLLSPGTAPEPAYAASVPQSLGVTALGRAPAARGALRALI